MTKLAALVTTIVLGSSTFALARPANPDRYRPPVVQPQPRPQPAPQQRWQTLGTTAQLDRGRTVLDVRTPQRFSKIKLDVRGSVFVDKVIITFANGERQVAQIDRMLGNGRWSMPAMIDLDGRMRQIDRIAIVAKSNGARDGGTFGYRGRTAITVQAL